MLVRSIAEAVERAYTAFADQRLPDRIDFSPSKSRRKAVDAIRSVPLRQLGAEQLSHYAFCAMTTVGDVVAYRHFLPRILEVAAQGVREVGLEPELIAGKLVYGGWRGWCGDRQAAVTDLFESAFWQSVDMPIEDDGRIENWLTGMAVAGLPLYDALNA